MRSLEVEANEPPEEFTFLQSPIHTPSMVVSAAKLLVTVKSADNPLSEKVTSVTALEVPSTNCEVRIIWGPGNCLKNPQLGAYCRDRPSAK